MLVNRRSALLGLGSLPLAALELGCEAPAPNDASASASTARSSGPPTATASPAAQRWDKLVAERDKLRPLHERAGKPKPGEWRYEHPERGQTFEEYVRRKPTVPTAERRTLVIQPLGPFDPARAKILDLTVDYMGRYFNLPTRREPALALDVVPSEARRVHPSWGDKQLLSSWLLHKLLEPRLPKDAAALIAFTTSDLWPEDGWNFVFGEADLKARVGVWSVYRHGDPKTSKEAHLLALRRALKVAVHETGHMFSLEHCTAYRCVQAGINSLEEDDRSPLWLCPECVTKVVWATEHEHLARYASLASFCRDAGLEEEAAFFARSIDALKA